MSALLATLVGAGIVVFVGRGLTRWETRALYLCFLAHVVCAAAQLWMQSSFYEGSDVLVYLDYGRMLATLMGRDPVRWAPEVCRLILHLRTDIRFYVFGESLSTGTMSGLAGIAVYVVGDSPLAVFVCVSIWVTLGSQAMYRAARRHLFSEAERKVLAASILLVPSVVFWSSTLAKEAVTFGLFGWMCAGLLTALDGRWVRGTVIAAPAAVGIALLKPYTLFPFVLAIGAAVALARRRPRPGEGALYVFAGIAVSWVGLLAMGRLFPDFSIGRLAQTAATYQLHGAESGGGSYTALGDPAAQSFLGQLRFLPLAILNAFFRPAAFDVRNVTLAAAAVETTVLLGLVIAVMIISGPRRAWAALRSSPHLTFSLVFTMLFAVGVGMATTNLGTLSRYRMPMMPFYVFVVLDLYRRANAERRERSTLPDRGVTKQRLGIGGR